MILEILPDLLRGTLSAICILILLPILSNSKIGIQKHLLFLTFMVIIDLAVCVPFYIVKDYTAVLYYTLLMYVITVLGLKFLLKESLYKWLFNGIIVLNVYAIIVIASYYLSYAFPYPAYANTAIRLTLFIPVIVVFKKLIRPLYIEVSENWGAFLLPTAGILASFLYILMSLDDIQVSMNQNLVYFNLLTVVTILTYTAIILSLKSLRDKFFLREENIKRQANEMLLKSEILSYESSVNAAKHTKHDIRHHNAILLEYLNNHDIVSAKNYLKYYDDSIQELTYKEFSKNPIANAVFRIYERRAKQHNVKFAVQAQADTHLAKQLPDIGVVLSNILENALTAARASKCNEKYIYYRSIIQNNSILIEIKNTVDSIVVLDNGLPVTTKKGGGTGLLSVKHIIERHQGMLDLGQDKQQFYTRIILPMTETK